MVRASVVGRGSYCVAELAAGRGRKPAHTAGYGEPPMPYRSTGTERDGAERAREPGAEPSRAESSRVESNRTSRSEPSRAELS